MPELPEVEALAAFLRENAVGHVLARADLASVQAIKTFDPPLSALAGLEITGASRHGKFLDLDVSGCTSSSTWRGRLAALAREPAPGAAQAGQGSAGPRVHLTTATAST